jgi:protoporphyrinogen oxidase
MRYTRLAANEARLETERRAEVGGSMAGEHIIVVGGGPAGLTAAYELLQRGMRPTVLERDALVGGLARTECYRGFHFDIGGHRFYSKIEPVRELWEHMLGEDFLVVARLSRIYHEGRFFRYPLDSVDALRTLGLAESTRVVSSYVRARLRPAPREDTFETWVVNRFGRRLYALFFKHYTEKVWGISCDELSADWAAQRIKGLSLSAALKNALFGTNGSTSLIDEFRYPRLGPGMMWRRFQQAIDAGGGRVELHAEVVRLHRSAVGIGAVTVRQHGECRTLPADSVISSMPITHLVERLDEVPSDVRAAAAGLRYRAFVLVGLIIDRRELFPDNWIYVHSPDIRAGRIQNFKNWSAEMVPDPDRTSVGLEYFCSEGDDLWIRSDAELVELAARELVELGLAHAADISDGVVFRHAMAYPVYDREYAARVRTIRRFLETIGNLQTIGRNGMYRYNNQDHSMLTGMLAVRNLCGERHDLWEVNTDRSYAEEWMVPAGHAPPRLS